MREIKVDPSGRRRLLKPEYRMNNRLEAQLQIKTKRASYDRKRACGFPGAFPASPSTSKLSSCSQLRQWHHYLLSKYPIYTNGNL